MATLLALAFTFFKKDAIACELIGLTHFTQGSGDLYFDQSIDDATLSTLRESIVAAEARISRVYGAPIANPRIIATAESHYAQFGFNPTGRQSSGFFRECVFLGPKGLNTDVIAHELAHAEVRYRTDLFVELTELPAWFIEGTGIMVDYRTPFLPENIKVDSTDVEKVKSVFYFRDFANTNVGYYQASRLAVEPLNTQSLYDGLERLNQGESFEQVFAL